MASENEIYDLVGIGAGLFNLSLSALSEKTELKTVFLDRKKFFDWHPEISFSDAEMQTTFLKDLVSPVDPTNRHSFLNYLVEKKLFYSFVNTARLAINRREFEKYCQWSAKKMSDRLMYNQDVQIISHSNDCFEIKTQERQYLAKNICIGTGISSAIPNFALEHLGSKVFHAKSPELKNLNAEDRRVLIVGGGQTGLEVFRNCLHGRWGKPRQLQLVSRRHNLEPLDNSPFVNEYFGPNYVEAFTRLPIERKKLIVDHQKLASDGNTPTYLMDLYRDLYQLKNVEEDLRSFDLLPMRTVENLKEDGDGFRIKVLNAFTQNHEELMADIVILCTGFAVQIPKALDGIKHLIEFDSEGRFQLQNNFEVKWEYSEKNKIFAFNFGRYNHGISEPQTSLMAWRSAKVLNTLCNEVVYDLTPPKRDFVNYL